ncbi:hypothetical protein DVH05_002594 [Phytophthora capsici]|nr:hypothetical protein DVH05_002594 [Phytophthora capsici]
MRLTFVLLAAAVLTCTDATPATYGEGTSTIESPNRLRSNRNLKEKKTKVTVDDLSNEERASLFEKALFWSGLAPWPLSRSKSAEYVERFGKGKIHKPLRTETGVNGVRVISEKEYQAKLALAVEAAAKTAKNDKELASKVKTLMNKLQKSAKVKAKESPI